MRALVVDHSVPGRLALGEVPDPVPGPDEVLVKISAISLNYGELPKSDDAAEGAVPGWDAAGVVERAAASGAAPSPATASSPSAGMRAGPNSAPSRSGNSPCCPTRWTSQRLPPSRWPG